jgi:hypothetical protein
MLPPFPTTSKDTASYTKAITTSFEAGYGRELREFLQSLRAKPLAVAKFIEHFSAAANNANPDRAWLNFDDDASRFIDETRAAQSALLDNGPPWSPTLTIVDHGPEITIKVGWITSLQGRSTHILWDVRTLPHGDPVGLLLSQRSFFSSLDYRSEPPATHREFPKLGGYHPERFKALRSYSDVIGKLYRYEVDPTDGLLTRELLNKVAAPIIAEANEKGMGFPRRHKEGLPPMSTVLSTEISLATAFGRYVQAGRQIMDFPLVLTEMLSETDVDDIPLQGIKMPYAAQYLHFGPQRGLELEPGWFVDGAYVEQRGEPGNLRFTVTASNAENSQYLHWYVKPEPQYTQDFVEKFTTMDLGTAIDTVLAAKLTEKPAGTAKEGASVFEGARAGVGANGPQVVDVSNVSAAWSTEATTRRHAVYKKAVQLAVNSLCYVSAYPEDIQRAWPPGSPSHLTKQADEGTPKERKRATSKLAALGYVPVHLCGQLLIRKQTEAASHAPGGGTTKATHWRRGHWRNQTHGPGRSLKKLIWVMPMLIGGKNADEPDTGHIYLVT